eukprot:4760406-Prymnesium_polylepis.1
MGVRAHCAVGGALLVVADSSREAPRFSPGIFAQECGAQGAARRAADPVTRPRRRWCRPARIPHRHAVLSGYRVVRHGERSNPTPISPRA